MAVVKADGYGHGIIESARAARAGGAAWLGVAFVSEALASEFDWSRWPALKSHSARAEALAVFAQVSQAFKLAEPSES